MKLAELDPEFLKIEGTSFLRVESISEADGIMFQCPTCFLKNGGPIGVHSIICWRPKVPQTIPPVPGRWEFQGSGINDLTLVAGSSSILIQGACNAHFFIKAGAIEMC